MSPTVASRPATWAIAGASRGLGLELVQQLVADDSTTRVVATARNPAKAVELQELAHAAGGRVLIVALDSTKPESAEAAAKQVEEAFGSVDYLVNNAGYLGEAREPEYLVGHGSDKAEPLDQIRSIFETNILGTIVVTRAFLPLLLKGSAKTVVNVSSIKGSLAFHKAAVHNPDASKINGGAAMGYGASKAVINMLTLGLANQFKRDGFVFASLHPGWVATDMGKQGGDFMELEAVLGKALSPEESARGQLKTIRALTADDNGAFVDWLGNPVEL